MSLREATPMRGFLFSGIAGEDIRQGEFIKEDMRPANAGEHKMIVAGKDEELRTMLMMAEDVQAGDELEWGLVTGKRLYSVHKKKDSNKI